MQCTACNNYCLPHFSSHTMIPFFLYIQIWAFVPLFASPPRHCCFTSKPVQDVRGHGDWGAEKISCEFVPHRNRHLTYKRSCILIDYYLVSDPTWPGGRIIDNRQIDNLILQIDNLQIDNQQITFFHNSKLITNKL